MTETGPRGRESDEGRAFTRPDLGEVRPKVPEVNGAQILNFEQAAARRRDEARDRIDELAVTSSAESEVASPPPDNETALAPVIPINEAREFISTPENTRGDVLGEYRAAANATLSRLLQDSDFERELLARQGLGSDLSPEGISDAMAVAAAPFIRRALRAAGRGSRTGRMESYVQAASDYANDIGWRMKWEKDLLGAYYAGLAPSQSIGYRLVEYKPPKNPTNFLKRRRLRDRLGVHVPSALKFK
jgi:hypothetical protein